MFDADAVVSAKCNECEWTVSGFGVVAAGFEHTRATGHDFALAVSVPITDEEANRIEKHKSFIDHFIASEFWRVLSERGGI